MISLSLIAVVYIGFVALVQQDMKKLIAYSSIAHMGFVTLGSFLAFELMRVNGDTRGAAMGIDGAMVQMISHGLISGAMFFCVGVLYDRVHSREISAYGGVVNTMPIFATFAVLFALANSGLPATSGFVGEFLVILASFRADFWYAFLAGLTLILGAAYTLWLVKRVIFGEVANEHVAELDRRQRAASSSCSACSPSRVLLLGLWPAPLLEVDAPDGREPGAADHARRNYEHADACEQLGDLAAGGCGGDLRAVGALCVMLLIDVFLSDRSRWLTYVLSLADAGRRGRT